jgi:hypothetical protein
MIPSVTQAYRSMKTARSRFHIKEHLTIRYQLRVKGVEPLFLLHAFA